MNAVARRRIIHGRQRAQRCGKPCIMVRRSRTAVANRAGPASNLGVAFAPSPPARHAHSSRCPGEKNAFQHPLEVGFLGGSQNSRFFAGGRLRLLYGESTITRMPFELILRSALEVERLPSYNAGFNRPLHVRWRTPVGMMRSPSPDAWPGVAASRRGKRGVGCTKAEVLWML